MGALFQKIRMKWVAFQFGVDLHELDSSWKLVDKVGVSRLRRIESKIGRATVITLLTCASDLMLDASVSDLLDLNYLQDTLLKARTRLRPPREVEAYTHQRTETRFVCPADSMSEEERDAWKGADWGGVWDSHSEEETITVEVPAHIEDWDKNKREAIDVTLAQLDRLNRERTLLRPAERNFANDKDELLRSTQGQIQEAKSDTLLRPADEP